MNIRRLITAAITLAMTAALAQSAELTPEIRSTAERIAVSTCGTCHGAQGTSIVPKFPNLAAQPANYLAAQLKAFRSRSRGDPDALAFMWGMAAALDDAQIDGLAQYYSSAKPARSGASGDRTMQARGKEIYELGVDTLHVPPCRSCHGSKGEGMLDFPRLAGQHPQYFLNQMRSFQSNLRSTDIMRPYASALNRSDLEALAQYIQSM
ncbi:MAG: c-type cytochrome [Steroidobacteraceae bacterium]